MKKVIPIILIIMLCLVLVGILAWSESLAPEGSHDYAYVPTAAPAQNVESQIAPSPEPSAEPTPEPTPEPVFPAGIHKGKYEQQTEVYGGQYLEYNVVVPVNADKNMPLVVYLPGDSMNDRVDLIPESEFAKSVKEIYGDEFPFIMLLPCTRFNEWHDGWIAEVLKGLIDKVADEYSVDKNKIILTGYSRGAEGGWGMVEDYGDYFSCFVPVSCGGKIHNFDSFINVPVWAFHGSGQSDKYMCQSIHYYVDRINEKGGNAKYDILDGHEHGTTIDVAYTKEVIEWMLAQ